ncbi:MAG: hypothetical protein F2806_07075 [Actinobacteria bacterium]|uniref:Unannotated protein n=1 Tax=freshwater metagenome TaxID=449393 RepID=A0A6J7GT89_9ZZZZ|nr:hypothetical protein [Actinomycetota bacterium]
MPAPVIKDLHALGARLHFRWLVAPIVALIAVVFSFIAIGIPIWLAWVTTDHGTNGLDQLLRLIGNGWLAVQAVPIQSGGAIYAILPWGMAIVSIFAIYRAGVVLGKRLSSAGLIEIGILAVVFAIVYGVSAMAISSGSSNDITYTSPWRAGLTCFVLALVVVKVALIRSTKVGRQLLSLMPDSVKVLPRAATAGFMALIGAGAFLALVSLAWHFSQAKGIFEFLTPNFFGGLIIVIAGIGYLPVLVLWSTSYLLGAGFVIGPGIGMSPFVPAPPSTQLPAFPLLAALPEKVGPIAWGLPVIAVIVGVGIGLMVARGTRQPALVRLGIATAATLLVALALGLMSALASGSLGDIRLATLGPDPILVGLLAFALTSIGAIPTALALRMATAQEVATEVLASGVVMVEETAVVEAENEEGTAEVSSDDLAEVSPDQGELFSTEAIEAVDPASLEAATLAPIGVETLGSGDSSIESEGPGPSIVAEVPATQETVVISIKESNGKPE